MASKQPLAIDVHAHALIPEVEALVAGQEVRRREIERLVETNGKASVEHNQRLMQTVYQQKFARLDERLAAMDTAGIDVQAVSVVPTQYYYWAEPALAEKIVAAANAGIAELCAARGGRFVGLGSVSMQHPELAPAQLEHVAEQIRAFCGG